MTAYRIVRGTLSIGTAGTWGVQSGGVELDYPTGWKACLNGSNLANMSAPYSDCTLAVDLEGGGQLRGSCSVIELEPQQIQVQSDGEPAGFVQPTCAEAD